MAHAMPCYAGVARLPPWINTLAATGADTLEPAPHPAAVAVGPAYSHIG